MDYKGICTFNDIRPIVGIASKLRDGSPKLAVHNQNLKEIVEAAESRPVSVISIVGTPNSGKSLLYSYLATSLAVREVDSNYDVEHGIPEFDWQNDEMNFADSIGIWSISRPFILPNSEESSENGGEVAVILLYCNASIDRGWSTDEVTASILGLIACCSSCILFNCYKLIDEQFLAALSTYVCYGLSSNQKKEKYKNSPLQDVVFVIRDWNYSTEYSYGVAGGRKFVNSEKLREKPTHSKESRINRQLIKSVFNNITGCLLPFPGYKTIQDGEMSELSQTFKQPLVELINHVLGLQVPQLKRDTLTGSIQKASDWLSKIEQYVAFSNTNNGTKLLNKKKLLKLAGSPYSIQPSEYDDARRRAIKTYNDYWVRMERKNDAFLPNEPDIKQIDKDAKRRAIRTFEKECKSDNDQDDGKSSDDSDDDNNGVAEAKKLLQASLKQRLKKIKEDFAVKFRQIAEQIHNDLVNQYEETIKTAFPIDSEYSFSEKLFLTESTSIIEQLKEEYLERLEVCNEDNLNEEQEFVIANLVQELKAKEKMLLVNLKP